MIINEDDIFYEDIVDEELALACLLASGICFLHNTKDHTREKTVAVSVICSDIFEWGYSDAEGITSNNWQEPSEIIDLYRLWKLDNQWGSVKWCCLKRGMQPQSPVKKMMVESGSWDEILESLKPNSYDLAIIKRNKEKMNDN